MKQQGSDEIPTVILYTQVHNTLNLFPAFPDILWNIFSSHISISFLFLNNIILIWNNLTYDLNIVTMDCHHIHLHPFTLNLIDYV